MPDSKDMRISTLERLLAEKTKEVESLKTSKEAIMVAVEGMLVRISSLEGELKRLKSEASSHKLPFDENHKDISKLTIQNVVVVMAGLEASEAPRTRLPRGAVAEQCRSHVPSVSDWTEVFTAAASRGLLSLAPPDTMELTQEGRDMAYQCGATRPVKRARSKESVQEPLRPPQEASSVPSSMGKTRVVGDRVYHNKYQCLKCSHGFETWHLCQEHMKRLGHLPPNIPLQGLQQRCLIPTPKPTPPTPPPQPTMAVEETNAILELQQAVHGWYPTTPLDSMITFDVSERGNGMYVAVCNVLGMPSTGEQRKGVREAEQSAALKALDAFLNPT